jgi:Flp pilus assembly protein TadG
MLRILKSENGQVLVFTVLWMSLLMGCVAMAVDVGMMFRAKRSVQTAADAAAFAGALDYLYRASTTSAVAVGKAASSSNGYTDGSSGVVVTINTPPVNGPNAGATGYVEAIITEPNPTVFMSRFFGASFTVGARGVAGPPGPSTACVYILNPTASQAMELQGSFTVSAPNCGIVVDSNDPDGLDFTGAGGSLTAGSVSVVGGAGGHTGDSTPAPVTGASPVSDPLGLTGPTPTNGGCGVGGDGYTGESGTTDTTTTTLTGVVAGPGGSGKAICYTKAIALKNATLGTGIYVFENGVTTSGTITSGAGGTTLDVYSGAFNVSTGTTLALVAPQNPPGSSTAYQTNGIALMQPLSNTSQITIQKGDASGSLTGIIYAPGAELYLQDSGGDKSGGLQLTSDLIINTLFDKTATLTINSYSQTYPTSTPLKSITLVE